MNRINQKKIALLVLAVSIFAVSLFFLFQEAPERKEPPMKKTYVNVARAIPVDETAVVTAYGVVEGDRILTVTPQVSGRIIEMSSNMVEGGILQTGEIMVRIDPRDFEAVVQQEKAMVKKAEADLKLEKGKSIVAEREWELLKDSIPKSDLGQELALRIPQLKEKEAALEAAKSRLTKAKLDLERTMITTPFDSIITEKFVEHDQFVTPSTKIATIVAIDDFRVQISIPYNRLKWIHFENEKNPSIARVVMESNGQDIVKRDASVMRLLGGLDPKGNMARVLLRIKDPLGVMEEDREPLLLGSHVRAEIEGPQLENVFVLPRRALRDGDRVFVKSKEGRLQIQEVDVVMRRPKTILIQGGIEEGDEVIISPIALPIEGMDVESVNAIE